jgi:hypothetical protein
MPDAAGIRLTVATLDAVLRPAESEGAWHPE